MEMEARREDFGRGEQTWRWAVHGPGGGGNAEGKHARERRPVRAANAAREAKVCPLPVAPHGANAAGVRTACFQFGSFVLAILYY